LTSVVQFWFQANHRIAEAVAAPGRGDAVRCLLFSGVFVAGLGAVGGAWAVSLSAAVPAAVLGANRQSGRPGRQRCERRAIRV
jgi:hypothetical protein